MAGIAKITPSILSSIPPCPGKIFPVSFIFANRLKYEIIKSPNWHAKDISKQNKIIVPEKFFSSPEIISIPKGNKENKKDPKLPENVLPTITDRDFVIATVVAPTILVEPEKTEETAAAEGEAPAEGTEEAASTEDKTEDKAKAASADKSKSAKPEDKAKATADDKGKSAGKETKKK